MRIMSAPKAEEVAEDCINLPVRGFIVCTLGDLGIDGKMGIREIGCEGVGWIRLAQDKNRCGDLMNTMMYLWVQ
jgi:hypothetical protein